MRAVILVVLSLALGLALGLEDAILAQGCSDAGVCSIGSLKAGVSLEPVNSWLGISNSFGLGEADGNLIPIWTLQVEGQFRLSSSTFSNVKIPFQVAHGNLGTTYGLGDL